MQLSGALEQLASGGEHLVQCVLEVRTRFSRFPADLLGEFFVALLDFVAEELTQRAVAKSFFPLLRMICAKVGPQRTFQAARTLAWIFVEERVDRLACRGRSSRGSCRGCF